MNLNVAEPVWEEFAKSKNANLKYNPILDTNQTDSWAINVENNFKIDFIFSSGENRENGKKPLYERTEFLFPIEVPTNFIFEMHPNTYFSFLTAALGSRKVPIGSMTLDESFIFISNDEQLLKTFTDPIKLFLRSNKMKNFSVKLKKNNDEKLPAFSILKTSEEFSEGHLSIQVSQLLKNKVAIETFFDLGKSIRDLILNKYENLKTKGNE